VRGENSIFSLTPFLENFDRLERESLEILPFRDCSEIYRMRFKAVLNATYRSENVIK
jgi:hypothetical protein